MNIDSILQVEDTVPHCQLCGGKLALVSGTFNYEPDDEPFENGKEEFITLDSNYA